MEWGRGNGGERDTGYRRECEGEKLIGDRTQATPNTVSIAGICNDVVDLTGWQVADQNVTESI